MRDSLCITVRFLDGAFHGRADRGEPEWPPSPLRLFQSLVAAGAAHWNERAHLERAAPALRWLEAQPAPLIVAPRAVAGAKYRLYVPDNVGDKVAASWARGNEASMAEYRAEKDVRPTRLLDGDTVHYLWLLPEPPDDFLPHREILFATVGSITHLGWGVDMAVGHATTLPEPEAAALPGRRWQPFPESADNPLRVPVAGTLADLESKHAAFLNRTAGGRFSPVPPLSRFSLVSYLDSAAPLPPPTAAFSLLQPDASGYRVFDPVRDGMRVAGMLRHAASQDGLVAALGWNEEKRRREVLGHGESPGDAHVPVNGPRIAFLPLPSLEYRPGKSVGFVVGSIRRVLLAGVRGQSRADLHDLARLLSGQELVEEETSQPAALLSRLPRNDSQVQNYLQKASVWATVTPMILPGHDDRGSYRARLFRQETDARPTPDSAHQQAWLEKLDTRTDLLLRKAIRQAGYSEELTRHAELSWRGSGFCRGVAMASAYAVPQKLRRFRRLHVRIAWRDAAGSPVPVTGPLCLGGGRFVGLGLFCALSEPGNPTPSTA